jgi:hypothetical protein
MPLPCPYQTSDLKVIEFTSIMQTMIAVKTLVSEVTVAIAPKMWR